MFMDWWISQNISWAELNFWKTSSLGFIIGEYGGRNNKVCLVWLTRSHTSWVLWRLTLSKTNHTPSRLSSSSFCNNLWRNSQKIFEITVECAITSCHTTPWMFIATVRETFHPLTVGTVTRAGWCINFRSCLRFSKIKWKINGRLPVCPDWRLSAGGYWRRAH